MDTEVTVDRLEQELLAAEREITRLRLAQAERIRVLDVAQVPLMDGSRSMVEWLRARLDVTSTNARDLIDIAKTMAERPDLVNLVAAQGHSFDRLAATARLAASGADEKTIVESFGFDLGGVARLRAREHRMSRSDEVHQFRDRYVTMQDAFHGMGGRIAAELPGFEYRIVSKALEQRGDMFNDLPGPLLGRRQRLADALVSISQDSLDPPGPTDAEPSGRMEPMAAVLVDAAKATATGGETGAELEYGPRVGPMVLEQILCEGRIQLVGLSDGRPVVTSDSTRAIPPAIRRFVAMRDGECTIAGCTSRYRLQVHHVRHRQYGGNHDPDNLTTLCWFHHHVAIHRMGFRLDPGSPPHARRFLRSAAPNHDPP